ncbi:MAG TPA: BrnA antitoxin family protein [Casimicrobiaceae bacterium]
MLAPACRAAEAARGQGNGSRSRTAGGRSQSTALRDPDAKPLTEAEWKVAKPHARIGRPPKPDVKVAVKLRLDPDLLAVLKATGPGWQTRANRILRERFAM